MPQAIRKAVYSGDSIMTLNQSQQREIAKTLVYMTELGKDYGARALSALYRSARKTSQQNEILAIAIANGLVSSNEFVI
jgi:polyhydroxyalkanoate synthesis regulator phasin